MEQLEDPVNDTVPTDKLNYERFINLLIEMCALTDVQAQQDCPENQLAFDLWEIIAPKVDKELAMSVSDVEQINEMEDEYMEKVKQGSVKLVDVKTILMGILRFNDGKRFVDATDAPLPASEGEIGFRKPNEPTGRFMLRYEELPQLRQRFEPFYLTRLQLMGQKIEIQKAMKAAELLQQEQEAAKPKLSEKSSELAMKARNKKQV